MIARFALPLVETQEEAEQDASRLEKVREGFNSPFWPFVVASTSIGQEGLDFHTYCHPIVHWNLPSNPVDMATRGTRPSLQGARDPEKRGRGLRGRSFRCGRGSMGAYVRQGRKGSSRRKKDLVPYWVYPLANGAHIERHVHTTPLSRDRERLEAIRRTLVVYRLVFGQPRQDDLVQYLVERNSQATEADLQQLSATLIIDLSPPAS